MGLFDSLTEIVLIKIRLALYSGLCFFSFVIIIGVAKMKDDAGRCPLYLDISSFRVVQYAAGCNYAFVVSIVQGLFYSIARIVILVLFIVGRITANNIIFSRPAQRTYTFFDLGACFMTFVCACVLSAGLNSIYSQVPRGYVLLGCCTAGQAAEAGAWIATVIYIAICVFAILYLIRTNNMPFYSKPPAQNEVYTVQSGNTEGTVTFEQAQKPPANDNTLRFDTSPY